MLFGSKMICRAAAAGALIPVLSFPQSGPAQDADHIVSPTEMQNAAVDAARQRQQNLDTLNSFFSSDKAEQALRSSKIDPQQVKGAIPSLSNQELAQLAQRAQNAQDRFAAGNMSDHDLLLILVVVAILILVIVAVH
jgi:hypothetical protein